MPRSWWILVACGAVGVALIVGLLLRFPVYIVPTPSMEPTLRPGNRIALVPGSRAWKPGELVIFDNGRGAIICQRVIGIPGDRLRFDQRQLIRNGVRVEESYTNRVRSGGFDEWRDNFPHGQPPPFVAQADRAGFAMMMASRGNGEVVVPPGHYFLMGDNRDNAVDSRFLGFVPAARIAGRAVRIW